MNRKYLILIIPIIVMFLMDRTLNVFFSTSVEHKLDVKLKEDNILAIGNSMFKTGIDFDVLNQMMPTKEHIDFEYHNGYYSNLWYLIFKNAILPANEHPKMIVWGFRPTYAVRPSFRQRKIGDIEKFYDGEDKYYEARITQTKMLDNDLCLVWLQNNSFFCGYRGSIKVKISQFLNTASVNFLKVFSSWQEDKKLENALLSGNISVSDLLVRRLTRGRFKTVEEKTVDAGKRFIKGEEVLFNESFIPDIASMISKADIPQLVLIFKPVTYLQHTMKLEHLKFTDDAKKYFKEHSIPYIDFLNDERIVLKYYAKGDHYNEEGRQLITQIISEKLNQLLGDI